MTNVRGDNFTLPAGLTEADLLDALEGAPMLADRRANVEAAVRADPRLAAAMTGMRADRAALTTLDTSVRAPDGLLAMVEAQLEREALAALAAPATAEAGTLRISAMTIERPSPFRTLLESLLVRRLALAASLLLAIGLGMWGIVSGIRNWPHAGPGGAGMASNTHTDRPGPMGPALSDSATDLAATGTSMVFDAGTIALLAPTSPLDGPGVAADGRVYDVPAIADLARDGRLAIVVHARDRASWSGFSARGLRWSDVSGAELSGSFATVSAALEREGAQPRERWAAGAHSAWGAGAAHSRRVIGVWVPAGGAGVRELLAATGITGGEPGAARVLVLDEPVRPERPLDARSVLWWSASPAAWDRGTIVPVIIEE
ncbi:MAG: hypothetical protein KF869_09505 [Phycisphaeraceae bacterium]|nr:hypothetical protein [Phycisphaeraceae bacterium]